MDREKLINDINKLIEEIVGMLEDEVDLIKFKRTLDQILVGLKYAKELSERLKDNIIDNIKSEQND